MRKEKNTSVGRYLDAFAEQRRLEERGEEMAGVRKVYGALLGATLAMALLMVSFAYCVAGFKFGTAVPVEVFLAAVVLSVALIFTLKHFSFVYRKSLRMLLCSKCYSLAVEMGWKDDEEIGRLRDLLASESDSMREESSRIVSATIKSASIAMALISIFCQVVAKEGAPAGDILAASVLLLVVWAMVAFAVLNLAKSYYAFRNKELDVMADASFCLSRALVATSEEKKAWSSRKASENALEHRGVSSARRRLASRYLES